MINTEKTPLKLLQAELSTELEKLNDILLSSLKTGVPLIEEIAKYILSAGGKRLRPLLTIASQRLFKPVDEEGLYLAGAVELIHTATLLHDDVVDDSHLRRGLLSANYKFGNPASVLSGDFLFSRAFQLMVACKTPGVLKILADASVYISEGEVMQLTQSHSLDLSIEDYLQIIQHKTAALFEAACEVGAMAGHATHKQIQSLKNYGYMLGVAFQITDDLLDYFPHPQYGKKPGDDFYEGKITLPLLLLYKKELIDTHLKSTFLDCQKRNTDFFENIRFKMNEHSIFEEGMDIAKTYISKAIEHIESIPSSVLKDCLKDLAHYVIKRCLDQSYAI